MRKLLLVLFVISCAVGASSSYADTFDTDTGPATTILLRTGDEEVALENDIAITAFTMDWYEDGEFEDTIEVKNIEYELIDEQSKLYKISYSEIENVTADNDISGGLIPGGPFPIIGPYRFGNSIFNVSMQVIYADAALPPLFPNSEYLIGIVFPVPKTYFLNRECRISNIVVSDLVTGEVVATLDEVEPGTCNTVILEKLDKIQEGIEGLDGIKEGVDSNGRVLDKILRHVRKILRILKKR